MRGPLNPDANTEMPNPAGRSIVSGGATTRVGLVVGSVLTEVAVGVSVAALVGAV